MQWLIDICKEWVEEWFATYVGFVWRGDPRDPDFGIGDFVRDNAWHTLSLSAIVPENAKGVSLLFEGKASAAAASFSVRRGGGTHGSNIAGVRSQVALVMTTSSLPVGINENREIDYFVSSILWTSLTVTVQNWWF